MLKCYLVFQLFEMVRSLQSNIRKWAEIGTSETVENWKKEGIEFSISKGITDSDFQNGRFSF